jgi:uncharacterized membrane protein YphA (DoxX/SURF4 family)
MKIFVKIVQVTVGLLFIISGLVKANDPVGLAYKMQEFFELWSEGFSAGSFVAGTLAALHKASLALSVFMITLEIIAGVALLLGWKKKAGTLAAAATHCFLYLSDRLCLFVR